MFYLRGAVNTAEVFCSTTHYTLTCKHVFMVCCKQWRILTVQAKNTNLQTLNIHIYIRNIIFILFIEREKGNEAHVERLKIASIHLYRFVQHR